MIGIAICILAIILVLMVSFIISYQNTEKQLKKQNEIYIELKKEVIENIRSNAQYVNQEIDNVVSIISNIFVDKIKINNSENIYEISSLYAKTDITAEKLKKEIQRKEVNINYLENYSSRLNDINELINKYNNTIIEIHKISRTFFGNSIVSKYNLKDIEKIIVN